MPGSKRAPISRFPANVVQQLMCCFHSLLLKLSIASCALSFSLERQALCCILPIMIQ